MLFVSIWIAYRNLNKKNIRKAGFYIGEPSFLGASPDDVIEGSDSLKIIEIKCPYSVRDLEMEEACAKSDFYCTLSDGLFQLKQNHQYYYQIQGTMANYQCRCMRFHSMDN